MPAPNGAPSLTDLLARNLLAIADQTKSVRAGVAALDNSAQGATDADARAAVDAQLDALTGQVNAVLEVIRMLQQMESDRIAAATLRVEREADARRNPPVFGRRTMAELNAEENGGLPDVTGADASDAPALKPVPAMFACTEATR